MAHIYFTFANEDADIATSLAGPFRDNGQKLYLTLENPKHVGVVQELSLRLKYADFYVVIISKHSKRSKWVKTQASQVIGYYREKKKPIIIPVLLDNEDLPTELVEVYDYTQIGSRENIEDLTSLLSNTISRLIGEAQAIEEEKKATIARVEANAATYIKDSLERLKEKEKNYRNIAYFCYFLCGISLIGSIIFLLFKADLLIHTKKELTIFEQIQSGARYLFLIGKSFMVESLRNSDRIHAISFGEFYLKAFPDKAEWNDIKEVFQHWNIDGGSSFITQSATDFDPEIVKNFIEFTKVITTKK